MDLFQELKEDIYTIPNVLTFGRLLAAPYIGHLILHNDYNQALGLFVLAGFTDLVNKKGNAYFIRTSIDYLCGYKLDGYIARKYNMKTLLGTIIDPAADKVLMTVMTITLAMEGVLPGTVNG